MMNKEEKLALLQKKLEELQIRQNKFQQEIHQLRKAIAALQTTPATKAELEAVSEPEAMEHSEETPVTQAKQETKQPPEMSVPPSVANDPSYVSPSGGWLSKENLEAFIGGNIINKIGILILVIGVAIGAKYSIDNNLVSPLTRIVLGYITGIVLLGFSLKLREKYEPYSAVLLSGALAILYFITFFGYSVYGLFPQLVAFGLMVLFTVFTVVAAWSYDRQVIAIIGLVGAYGVPFFLSNNSGNAAALFTYISIINIGILVISLKKYWRHVFHLAFLLTWLIFAFWFVDEYPLREEFSTVAIFLPVFFLTFYITFLAYKLIQQEEFKARDVVLVLTNSFIFYGFGFLALAEHELGENYLGFFTLLNALLHFAVGFYIYKQQNFDKKLFYLIAGMVLIFITITIPVQLDGNWVTLLWAGEAALLFWIGRTKQVGVYEKLSYPLMFLAFFSLMQDYHFEGRYAQTSAFFNLRFLSGLLVMLAFGFMNKINVDYAGQIKFLRNLFPKIILPAFFLIILYHTFYFEIDLYWRNAFRASIITSPETNLHVAQNYDLRKFNVLWVLNYSLFFFGALSLLSVKFFKQKSMAWVNIFFSVVFVFFMLSNGLLLCGELRESYLNRADEQYFNRGIMYLAIRYICYGFVGFAMIGLYRYLKSNILEKDLTIPFDIFLHLVILWVLSSELLHWMGMAGSLQSDKLALSILWGIYALFLVSLGIWKKLQHYRLSGIVLFGITLAKLFFYDLTHLNNLSKTIVLVSLGVLLLLVSFLYNKYNDIIEGDKEN